MASSQFRPEHPENDLSESSDADYANLQPPAPRTVDELADQEDPVRHSERNRQSTRQAWQYLALSIMSSLLFALIVALIFRFTHSGECDARLVCTLEDQRLWAIIASLPPIAFLLGSGWIMVRKLKAYLRWRSWMAVFWILVPFTMWFLVVTVQVGLSPTLML
ncbi:hypothetical protein [Corynebacterium tapiri]|uniref:Uncharacterized protein n=1 Tax=Corynebacterium tapiri TaxID=1448266 RepID=A0A5C4U1M2_9CORY|nr:hypothetical protein [Corynebacterium tapiri]TNL95347.1 hypothetical protein FHE74_09695 [Corynebacterium tapiri]